MPAASRDALAAQARGIAGTIADALDYVGVIGGRDVRGAGATDRSSWSTRSPPGCTIPATGRGRRLDLASSSSISAPLPAGRSASRLRHGDGQMKNLIGDEITATRDWLDVPGATVHLYGKGTPARAQDGHVTRVTPPGKK